MAKVLASVLILLLLIFSFYFYLISITSYYTFYPDPYQFHVSVRRVAQMHLFAFLARGGGWERLHRRPAG